MEDLRFRSFFSTDIDYFLVSKGLFNSFQNNKSFFKKQYLGKWMNEYYFEFKDKNEDEFGTLLYTN